MTDLPAALDHLDELAPLVDVPRLGLMVDFDGTLAPIAPTPDEAVISPAAFDALRRIAPAIEMVCLISGRALADLTARVDLPGATFVGSHGVEFLDSRRPAASSPAPPTIERPSRAYSSTSGRGSTTRDSYGRASRSARPYTSNAPATRKTQPDAWRPPWPTRPAPTVSSRSGARWCWSSSRRWGWTRATPSGSWRASGA